MLGALSLGLILVLTTSALPVTAQEQTETPRAVDLRGRVPGTGRLARAATLEAVRLAAREPQSFGDEAVPQSGAPTVSDWSRVRQLAPDTGIIVTLKNAPSVHGRFVAAGESELTVLNGIGDAERIARADVAEISVLAKHTGRHARRGFLIGSIVGASFSLAGLTVAGCGSASSSECVGEVALVVAGFGGVGSGIGALVGSVVPKRPDVIYRAP